MTNQKNLRAKINMKKTINKVKEHPAVQHLGPGLITGAADDDPSGIATYSQAGAQFGFNMLWTVVFTYPLMVGIQMVSARLGCITGKGLASNIREHFPVWVVYAVVGLLLVANTINIAADIAAMAEALRLIAGGSAHIYAVTFGLLCLVLQVFLPYAKYVRYLKWLTLALLSYVAVMFTIDVPWAEVAARAVWPQLTFNNDAVTVVVAVFGTTISPYLFFWQAAQEMENLRAVNGSNQDVHSSFAKSRQFENNAIAADMPDHLAKRDAKRSIARGHLRRIKWDTYVGMGFSNLVAFFIILTTAATLHASGVTNIQTSAQAAEALRPLAGDFTFLLFSLGIIGTGMLAVPVLAGSAAYAVAEAFNWRAGLDLKPEEGKGFYGIIAVATLGGVVLCFMSIDPMKELFYSAVINGVIAVPIMVVMMLLGSRREVMGDYAIGKRLRRLGWAATVVMAVAVLAMFFTA
jgi:NRAMP (natural resistance-associated macrophage protein)-like metal ion transporter